MNTKEMGSMAEFYRSKPANDCDLIRAMQWDATAEICERLDKIGVLLEKIASVTPGKRCGGKKFIDYCAPNGLVGTQSCPECFPTPAPGEDSAPEAKQPIRYCRVCGASECGHDGYDGHAFDPAPAPRCDGSAIYGDTSKGEPSIKCERCGLALLTIRERCKRDACQGRK